MVEGKVLTSTLVKHFNISHFIPSLQCYLFGLITLCLLIKLICIVKTNPWDNKMSLFAIYPHLVFFCILLQYCWLCMTSKKCYWIVFINSTFNQLHSVSAQCKYNILMHYRLILKYRYRFDFGSNQITRPRRKLCCLHFPRWRSECIWNTIWKVS